VVETSTVPAPAAEVERPVALWRNRDYLLLWGSEVVSSLGTQVSQLAFPLLILGVTGSPAWAGLLGALRGLPFVVLCLPVGALTDRWDRKRVMVLADAGRALALGSIPVALALGGLTLPHIGLVALVEGTLFTFFNLANIACLPRVVPRRQLPTAIAQSQASAATAEMVGPPLGGALFGLGSALPFLVDAVTFLVSAVSLRLIRAELQTRRAHEVAPGDLRRLWPEIGEGLAWLWRQPVLRFLGLLTSGLMTFSFGYSLIIIVLAQELGADPPVIGLLFASGGIGSILGSLAVAPLQRRFTIGQIMIGVTWVWALTWPLYVVAPDLLMLGIANAIGFVVVPLYMGTQFSYRLAMIPDHLQGRVNSAYRLVWVAAQPLSLALTGALLAAVGAVATVWLVMAPQVVLALAATLYRPLRQAPSLAELQRE
jgi:MFS family permease